MLTTRQQELLEYLRQFHQSEGVMPSTREIQRHFGFASQTAAVAHLRALEKKGVIKRHVGKARALVLNDQEKDLYLEVPIFGNIAAGYSHDNPEEIQGHLRLAPGSFNIPKNATPFALKVCGHSMINACIADGDHAILLPRSDKEPRSKDIVAALIDGETTLKRLVAQNGMYYLKSENPNYPNLIPARELQIQGTMVGLIRSYQKI